MHPVMSVGAASRPVTHSRAPWTSARASRPAGVPILNGDPFAGIERSVASMPWFDKGPSRDSGLWECKSDAQRWSIPIVACGSQPLGVRRRSGPVALPAIFGRVPGVLQ